jgi:hypothetical protein
MELGERGDQVVDFDVPEQEVKSENNEKQTDPSAFSG